MKTLATRTARLLRVCSVAIAIMLAVGCRSRATTNLLANGDMEAWPSEPGSAPDDWRLVAGARLIEPSPKIKHSGTTSAMLTEQPGNLSLLQSVAIDPTMAGNPVSCSAWVKTSRPRAVRMHVGDGHAFAQSSWHPGDARWYRLAARFAPSGAAIQVGLDVLDHPPDDTEKKQTVFFDEAECHISPSSFATSAPVLFLGDVWERAWLGVGNYWTFRSVEGGWSPPLIRTFDMRALWVFVEVASLVMLLLWLTDRQLERWTWPRILVWYAAAFAIQRAIGSLAPDELHRLIESESANSFYGASMRYSLHDFLSRYASFDMARHAETNMPGKVVFFYFLEALTHSTDAMANLVILISNLGGLLAFAIARKLSGNNRVAFYSMVFYFLIPGKIWFFPLLNTVTPVFLLLSFYLLLAYLDSRSTLCLVGLGVSLYWLLLFDPIPFALGLVFVAFLFKGWTERKIDATRIATMAVWIAAVFLSLHAALLAFFQFDIFRAFQQVVDTNRNFNLERPYGIWVYGNLWEFFLSAGIVQSLLALGFAAMLLRTLFQQKDTAERMRTLGNPINLLLLSSLVSIFLLAVLGLNRGEASRMWIFMTVFLQVVAAYLCALKLSRSAPYTVVAVSVFQTVATIYTVGVLLP